MEQLAANAEPGQRPVRRMRGREANLKAKIEDNLAKGTENGTTKKSNMMVMRSVLRGTTRITKVEKIGPREPSPSWQKHSY